MKIKEKIKEKLKKAVKPAKKTAKPVRVASENKPESDKNDDKIYFMALGGLEHVGQNMYVYKYKGKYLIVD